MKRNSNRGPGGIDTAHQVMKAGRSILKNREVFSVRSNPTLLWSTGFTVYFEDFHIFTGKNNNEDTC